MRLSLQSAVKWILLIKTLYYICSNITIIIIKYYVISYYICSNVLTFQNFWY